jgi:hypothetical protein
MPCIYVQSTAQLPSLIDLTANDFSLDEVSLVPGAGLEPARP